MSNGSNEIVQSRVFIMLEFEMSTYLNFRLCQIIYIAEHFACITLSSMYCKFATCFIGINVQASHIFVSENT